MVPRVGTPPATETTVSGGVPDLEVTIVSVTVDQWGTATAVFNISNVGTGPTGSYSFTAQLPTAQPYTYVSPPQASLAPSSFIANTLTFTQVINGAVSVTVDPAQAVRESYKGNNATSQYVTGSYNYQYQQYPQYVY
jgi:hypothetical protein